MWHLPDGRTLRVVTTPNAEGGVIYLFDDVTERLDLARRYDALIRVQGETLDNLAEAVAVFGSDGRLRLFNPVFARLWKLAPATLGEHPHIETVIGWCQPLSGDSPLWRRLRAAITAIDDREQVNGRIERRDGSVIDCATVAAARRRHAGHLPGPHRHRQRGAGAARKERCARGSRRDQGRLRAPRLLRAALAAHQHHRLAHFLAIWRPGRSTRSSANISATSPPRPMRCSPSSTISWISPASMPAP